MPSNPYILHAFKYAMGTLLVLGVGFAITAVLSNAQGNTLQGRLVSPQQRGITPTINVTAEDIAAGGVVLPPDTHIILSIPANAPPTLAETFLGGTDIVDVVRAWMYCYSGNEQNNKKQGKTGRQLYDGRFYYTPAELRVQNKQPEVSDDLLSLRERAADSTSQTHIGNEMATLQPGQTCYVMVDGITLGQVSGGGIYASLDRDGDALPDKRETAIDTDPSNADTDGDGISDGNEVMRTKTDPILSDTDRDGLSDLCEDVNANGLIDADETSPKSADTDHDGLCDGPLETGTDIAGKSSGCPEPRRSECTVQTDNGVLVQRDCFERVTTPVASENLQGLCGGWDTRELDPSTGETNPTKTETYPGMTDFQVKLNAL